ncbi:hypothetical protein B9G69_007660 [Bdellovibrio sp. SKB1291214]|uniref:hypothetical protein n=1 Tax=Bdellovibrio sp. SKB1291214 TaxID=1732569 RepID=UPI000B51BE82|nr:hypothetical protein [Bdellovibrio sp. SKB1291214]UYL10455.1 hypothetical protein B9G69_007660 [Bdellovibrio sp. SKB1291214]
MNIHNQFLVTIAFALLTSTAYAQSSLEGFSSGRYEVRKETVAPAKTKLKRNPAQATELPPKKVEATESAAVAPTPGASTTATAVVVSTTTAVPAATTPAVTPEPAEPTIGAQAEALFTNKADKIYDYYAETIHPDDIRNNRLEIEVSPVAVYNESKANYSFREYQSYYDALRFKANIWLTPLIGVSGKFMFSMAADLDAMDADKSRVPARYEFLDVGLNFRRYFGNSRKSNSLEFSLLYSDNKMNPPTDAENRMRLSTSGFGLGLKARLPSSVDYAWVIGGSLFPRLQHSESTTSTGVNSGSVDENSRLGIEFGGEWRLSRSSQLLWGLEASAERNMLDGAATQPDPSTGATPKNVGVTNSLYLFSLGYRWGH